MIQSEKIAFCRSLALLRTMYPSEYNISELTPTAYWLAYQESTLSAVVEDMQHLVRAPEWMRQMPPAPVLGAEARRIDKQRARTCHKDREPPLKPHWPTEDQARWADKTKTLSELYIQQGLQQGPALCKAILTMIDTPRGNAPISLTEKNGMTT